MLGIGLEFDSAEDDTTPLEPNAPTLSLLLLDPELPDAVVDEVLLLPMEFRFEDPSFLFPAAARELAAY